MRVRSYRDLRVWQRAMDLVCVVYAIARHLPPEERHALGDQLRRAAVSVPANIAEGHGRTHRREFPQFLAIAHASLCELETHITVTARVGYVRPETAAAAARLCDEVSRMLRIMRSRLGDVRPAHGVAARALDAHPPTLDARGGA